MIYILLFLLGIIFYQDVNERKVSLIVLITIIAIGGIIHWNNTSKEFFLLAIIANLICIAIVGSILWLYTKFKLKIKLDEGIGEGDLLFFIFMAVSFSIPAFLIMFSFSLIFSLILFLSLKTKLKFNTVPLAGFQALFIFIILFINLAFNLVNIYAI